VAIKASGDFFRRDSGKLARLVGEIKPPAFGKKHPSFSHPVPRFQNELSLYFQGNIHLASRIFRIDAAVSSC
jgi:hypothetical protein